VAGMKNDTRDSNERYTRNKGEDNERRGPSGR
jgi:hypothetical protein